jgi:hypothetical protein
MSQSQSFHLPIRLPAGEARRFVSALLGFGVAVGLFAAPFLGAKRIPGFEPLIAVFPEEHRKLLIPVSTLLIGLVTLALQFYAGEAIARRNIRKGFLALSFVVVASIVALLVLYTGFVVQDVGGYGKSYVIGWTRLPLPGCQCPPSANDRDCIEGLAFRLGSCWSDGSVFGVKVSLFLSYLISIEGFAGLVALLVLGQKRAREEEKEKQERERKPAKGGRRRKPAAPPASEAPLAEAAAANPEVPSGGDEEQERPKAVRRRRLAAPPAPVAEATAGGPEPTPGGGEGGASAGPALGKPRTPRPARRGTRRPAPPKPDRSG